MQIYKSSQRVLILPSVDNRSFTDFSGKWHCLKKGTNKSGALNLLSGALQEIEEMLAESHDDDHSEEETQPQLLINRFSFEELFNVMSRNTNKILARNDHVLRPPRYPI